MLSALRIRAAVPLTRSCVGARASALSTVPKVPLDVDGEIVEEIQHATGRRGAEVAGQKFNDKSLVPPAGAGTKSNPIEVPSHMECRAVGFEDPTTHAVYWFNLRKGKTHHVEMIDKYFKLVTY